MNIHEYQAKELLGKTLITHQPGPEGKEVKAILIEECCNIDKEYYLGFVLDRNTSNVTLIASEEGGTEIEKVEVMKKCGIYISDAPTTIADVLIEALKDNNLWSNKYELIS